ncbi:MAG: ImmA/IrrE family metallo-endopeptidase [Rhodospirillales bacterium]|nr:ImmA/IrrE family metallo-endopeptidase [Rhodospirillales bacterium]
MADVRGAILRGTAEAGRLHRALDMRARIAAEGGRVDVFGTIVGLGVPLIFKPLDGLLGAFMPQPVPGVLITTRRPLTVQRFTGAHELGHCRLGHRPSLDDETILRRMPFQEGADYETQELEADAFAAEFLTPSWLVAEHFRRQGWSARDIGDARTVYQLSLRIGASYQATCWALQRHKVIERPIRERLLGAQPRVVMRNLLQGYEPPHWWGDVWVITERDQGALIEGSRTDLFLVRLKEQSSAGYLWSFEELEKSGFVTVRDEREAPAGETIGGAVTRCVTARSEERKSGKLTFRQRRPWLNRERPLSELTLAFDLYGPEEEGWSQAERRRLAA